MTNLSTFRKIALAEGISFLLIFLVSMPLKYGYGIKWPNMVIGMGHGILFILYFIFLFDLRKDQKWTWTQMFWLALASIMPFGTFVADKKILAHDNSES